MKVGRYITMVMIVLIVFILSFTVSVEAKEQKPIRINIESHVKIIESGFIYRVDNISFINCQELVISNIIFRPSVRNISNLFSISTKINGKQAICEFVHELGTLNPSFRIKSKNEKISELTVSYTLINQYDYINQSTLNFSIPIYPIIQIDNKNVEIQSFNMTISIPNELILDTNSIYAPFVKWAFKKPENVLHINSTNVTTNDRSMIFFNLIGKIKQIICPHFEETLEIGSMKVKVLARILVQNKGNDEVREIRIEIPRNAEDVRVFDAMGDIKLDMDLGKVYLRYPLIKNYNYTFMVSCTLPVLDFKNNSEVKISIPHFVLFPTINTNIMLVFPSYVNAKPKYPLPMAIQNFPESVVFKYRLVNTTAYNSETLVVTYNEPTMHISVLNVLRLLSLTLIVLLMITLYSLYRRHKSTYLKLVPEHINIVKKLCLKYEEKISLIDELITLGDKLVEGSIKKRLYEQRINTIRNDLVKLDMEIKELKLMMKAKYADVINELEAELAKLFHILESIENYRKQYLLKKIKKGVYDELAISNKKQFRKSYAKILSLIKSLREELEEFRH
ncbi:MAG: hypothetical protein QXP91_12875 [Candidatus Methanomethylicia archaeon]